MIDCPSRCPDCIAYDAGLKVGLSLAADENARLKAEIKEARDEAATVRRAYLHEKGRAEAAIRVLKQNGYASAALTLERAAYRGPAERIAARDKTT